MHSSLTALFTESGEEFARVQCRHLERVRTDHVRQSHLLVESGKCHLSIHRDLSGSGSRSSLDSQGEDGSQLWSEMAQGLPVLFFVPGTPGSILFSAEEIC